MTKMSIVGVLVLGFVAVACNSAQPPAASASAGTGEAPAPAATAGDCGAGCAEACAGGCDKESTPAPMAKDAPAHELKPVKPSASYPLKTCLVTDEELGDLEDRAAFTYDGTEVQFCCPGCAKGFKSDPAKYLAKLAASK